MEQPAVGDNICLPDFRYAEKLRNVAAVLPGKS